MKLLIGTHNPSKLRAMQANFAPEDDVQCVSPASFQLHVTIPEDARDALGNAMQKALAYHRATGLPTLAEDSGLVFLDLPPEHPDQPGVHVRRMVDGHVMEDDEEMLRWYQSIAHRHGGRLRAAWQDAYCLVLDEAHIYTRADTPEELYPYAFEMMDTPCAARNEGWPIDSLSVCPYNGRYFADMTREERIRAYQAGIGEATSYHAVQDWLRSLCCAASRPAGAL